MRTIWPNLPDEVAFTNAPTRAPSLRAALDPLRVNHAPARVTDASLREAALDAIRQALCVPKPGSASKARVDVCIDISSSW